MSELEIRQGTVYENRLNEKRMLVINHNPMSLRSFALESAGKEAPFDIGHPRILTVDELIAMRKSGDWNDLGDIPGDQVRKLIRTILEMNLLPEEDIPFAKALLKE